MWAGADKIALQDLTGRTSRHPPPAPPSLLLRHCAPPQQPVAGASTATTSIAAASRAFALFLPVFTYPDRSRTSRPRRCPTENVVSSPGVCRYVRPLARGPPLMLGRLGRLTKLFAGLAPPTPAQSVYREDCTQCFDSIVRVLQLPVRRPR